MADPKVSKRALMAMSWEEQVEALFDLIAYVRDEQADDRNQRANDKREHVELAEEIKYVKGEVHGIGRRKERTLSTSDQIDIKFEKRMKLFNDLRDKVFYPALSYIFTFVMMAVLYLAFGGKVP